MALSLQQEQQSPDINWEQIPEGISDLELAKKLQEEEDRRASQFYQEQEQAAVAAAAQLQVCWGGGCLTLQALAQQHKRLQLWASAEVEANLSWECFKSQRHPCDKRRGAVGTVTVGLAYHRGSAGPRRHPPANQIGLVLRICSLLEESGRRDGKDLWRGREVGRGAG